MSKSLFVFARRKAFRRLFFITVCLSLCLSWLSPILVREVSAAGQITNRSLSLSTAISAQTGVTYTYTFQIAAGASPLQSIKFVACTSAAATYGLGGTSATTGCTAPTGLNINQGTQQGTLSGSWTNTTGFTRVTSTTGNCAPGNNVLCISRTQAANETNNTATRTVAWNTQTNATATGSGTAYYVGIYTYSDASFATNVDSGTVATAVVPALTVQAQVAEILQFCIGNTSVTDDVANPGGDCNAISGTTVNIGTLDPATVNISPINVNGGNNTNGIAMLRSNAANGATVSYRAIQASSGSNHLGTLRLAGANCSAASGIGTGSGGTPPAASGPYTDGCIDAAGVTQNPFSAGVEQFGMTISGVNCRSTVSYSCSYSAGTNNLQQQTDYIGGANATTFGATAAKGFAWDESGSTQIIASSTSSTIKQVDDEALILNFAATPSITTPFGSYSVQADFIAVPGY